MNYSFEIELLKIGFKATIYTIRFEGNTSNEMSKFYSKFEEDYKEDLDIIFSAINQIVEKRGIDTDYFRHEGPVFAIPKTKCKLRLYCQILSENILLIYKGGLKPKGIRTYQEEPFLLAAVNELIAISKLINDRIEMDEIEIQSSKLDGDLDFIVN